MKRSFLSLGLFASMFLLALSLFLGACATTTGAKASSHCCCQACNKANCPCAQQDNCGGKQNQHNRPCGDCSKDGCPTEKSAATQ